MRYGVAPVNGCTHRAAVTFKRYTARCDRCGAEWRRDAEGPWRLILEGAEPRQSSMIPPDDPDAGMRAD